MSFIHRAGSSLNEHLHFHCIVTDGVFAPSAGHEVDFFEASDMVEALIEDLTEKLRRRVLRYMVRQELIDEQVALDIGCWDHHGGFSLDASVRVDKEDRMALERLARYCGRPPFAEGRLSLARPEGSELDEPACREPAEPDTVFYRLTKPDPQGRSVLSLTPLELLERLAALIPPPRIHRHRYAGVLAPNSPLRRSVVASAAPAAALAEKLAVAAQKMDIENNGGKDHQKDATAQPQAHDPEPVFPSRASRLSWAMLLARIYEILPLLCPRCPNPLKVISFITQPTVILHILTHLDEPVETPAVAPAKQVPLCRFFPPRGRAPPVSMTQTSSQNSDC